eukprot:Nk52_evm12s147 gene=Nk52_evmTU12s147
MFRMLRKLFYPSERKVFAGKDHLGNCYYEVFHSADQVKPRRIIEHKGRNEIDYLPEHLPTEWLTWLKYSRKNPPTQEELNLGQRRRELVQERVQKLQIAEELEKKKLLQGSGSEAGAGSGADSGHEGAEEDREEERRMHEAQKRAKESQRLGHASSKKFVEVGSDKAVRSGDYFEPSSWVPPTDDPNAEKK